MSNNKKLYITDLDGNAYGYYKVDDGNLIPYKQLIDAAYNKKLLDELNEKSADEL